MAISSILHEDGVSNDITLRSHKHTIRWGQYK